MPIDVIDISDKEASIILGMDEGHFADLKSIDIGPAKLTKAMSAFANADGGDLFIGIDENVKSGRRTWRGFKNPEAANGHIQVFEELFPLSQDFQYEFLRNASLPGLVLKAGISKTQSVKYASNTTAYVRPGIRVPSC